ncbi:polynucleotide kinase 3 phosphatase-domain-containing protein [Cladochytrium replicatum]|nr:polynucleotide kinase 3 phosphatase-domain-containing protein [Cladochytrium replicatum]
MSSRKRSASAVNRVVVVDDDPPADATTDEESSPPPAKRTKGADGEFVPRSIHPFFLGGSSKKSDTSSKNAMKLPTEPAISSTGTDDSALNSATGFDLRWEAPHNTLLVAKVNGAPGIFKKDVFGEKRLKIAAYDLDGTLVTTKSGNVHAKDTDDWQFLFNRATIVKELKRKLDEGFAVIVISNQAGIGSVGKFIANMPGTDPKTVAKIKTFQGRATGFARSLGLPIVILAAASDDNFRKPCLGMWDYFVRNMMGCKPEEVDLQASFYVGDAAGRKRAGASSGRGKKGAPKDDFADTDWKFAKNIPVEFFTPETFFTGREDPTATFAEPQFNPRILANSAQSESSDLAALVPSKGEKRFEVVVLCGRMGSGKSTFYRRHFSPLGYKHVNQDTLKTREKCIKACSEYLSQGLSVVIDNTNRDAATRKHYTTLAKKHGARIRCFYFACSEEVCKHNDAVRMAKGERDGKVPRMAFAKFNGEFEEPKVSEGFDAVHTILFTPTFDSEEDRKAWAMYYR